MSALDELLRQWRSNPDADATIALCSFLGTSPREELIREVATSAETWHAEDGPVMLAVGRMHLDLGSLAEAQAALVAAGKANGRDAKAFRYLGEVLLRRGDALRAEKVLARALQFSPNDTEARLWHDRSVVYSALQKRIGVEAVATEVLRAMPKQNSIPAPTMSGLSHKSFGNEAPTRPHSQNPLSRPAASPEGVLPRFDSEDPVRVSDSDLVEESAPRISAKASLGRATTLGMGPPGPKLPSTAPAQAKAPAALARPNPQVGKPAAGSKHAVASTPPVATRSAQLAAARPVPAAPRGAPHIARTVEPFDEVLTTITPAPFIAPSWAEAPPIIQPPLPRPAMPPAAAPAAAAAAEPPAARAALAVAETMAAPSFASPAPFAPAAPSPVRRPVPETRSPIYSDAGSPDAGLVLQHLSRVGVYEPGGGAPPAWEKPGRQQARGTWALSVAIVLIGFAGAGSYAYSQKIRAERAQHALALNQEVKKLLETGQVADLRKTDQKLNEAFELDSLSQQAARLWLQNRVLYEVLTAEEVRGIDSAVHRGKTVNLPEKDTAFGRIASFMAEGDLAGGAAILSRWDTASARDPYYQLAAGAVLERAGDLRAVERYDAARQLDPEFIPAQLLLARLLLLEFGGERAKPVLEELRKKLGDAPITRALSALAWVVDPERSESLPDEAKLETGDAEKLPAPLSGVPAMVEAVQAMRAGDLAKVSRAIDSAVTGAMTPSLATGLGFLAIEAGDEQLARKAALRALQFAAVYPRARTLAARVALLGGRLDEAQKAIEELDPSAPDVAVVRGVVAYEALEPADLQEALRSLGELAHTRQAYTALAAGPGVLMGSAFPSSEKLEAMATPATPWGELVAADAALDVGDLALASKILSRRQGDALRPVHYLRLARLYRYQKKADEALKAAAAAREGSSTSALLIESLYAFLNKDDTAGARNLVAKHPTVLGPLTAWLGVLVDVANKQKAQAAARTAKLDLPPAETPLRLRILVARALVAAEDKRARPYVLALAKQVPKHPDVIAAALELND
jgi:tetratricopeptide (TPR) repeat protein